MELQGAPCRRKKSVRIGGGEREEEEGGRKKKKKNRKKKKMELQGWYIRR
jgi:hypothetical protein